MEDYMDYQFKTLISCLKHITVFRIERNGYFI